MAARWRIDRFDVKRLRRSVAVEEVHDFGDRSHGMDLMPSTTAASRALPDATTRQGIFFSRASMAMERTPRTGRSFPSSDNSPTIRKSERSCSLQQPHARRECHGQRKIEGRAFLLDVCRREVDRDVLIGKGESVVANRGNDAVAGFADGGVGQADDEKSPFSRS